MSVYIYLRQHYCVDENHLSQDSFINMLFSRVKTAVLLLVFLRGFRKGSRCRIYTFTLLNLIVTFFSYSCKVIVKILTIRLRVFHYTKVNSYLFQSQISVLSLIFIYKKISKWYMYLKATMPLLAQTRQLTQTYVAEIRR